MIKKMKLLTGIISCVSALFLSSCTDGVGLESWSSSVHDTQLESPVLSNSCFSTTETVQGDLYQFQWPIVCGAGGYKVNVVQVLNNEETSVITDSIVDGSKVLFSKTEDAEYKVSVQTLGNAELNNTGALTASEFYYTGVSGNVSIPANQDIAQFINNYINEHYNELRAGLANDPNNYQFGFTLQDGGSYTMNDSVDFRLIPAMLSPQSGDSHATVTVGEKGYLTTQAGLKVKNVYFDCTNMTQKGLLTLGAAPDSTLYSYDIASGTYRFDGANQKCFIIDRTITFQGCMVKNLAYGILYGNKKNWALTGFRVKDCLIQLVNETANSVINLYGASTGGLKVLTLQNSTFLNLKNNNLNGAYFLRLSNASNATPYKIWGTSASGSVNMTNCTFVKCMTGSPFANNYVSHNSVTFTVKGNIFYDTWRIQKFFGNCTKDFGVADNTIWGVTNPVDGTDKEKYATEEDPNFAGPFLQELDLTQKNGGVNLRPQGGIAVENQYGDSRWYEVNQ